MRAYWMTLLCGIVLSGCGFKETNALNLHPIASYAIEQEQGVTLGIETRKQLLTYCERQPEDVLPKRRAKVAETTFYHPLYSELGKKTIKYWASAADRYVTCLNSHEVVERTFKVEPIVEFEALEAKRFEETESASTLVFEPVEDVDPVMRQLGINNSRESVFPDSVFRYVTPDTGSLYVTFELIRNGRTLNPIIEPRLFPFESGNNEGYVFLTRRADARMSLQIGNGAAMNRVVLPKLFDGEYMTVDSKMTEVNLEGDHRQLLKRVVLSDEPVGAQLSDATSLSLSKTYGTVLEIWGHVRRPLTTRMSGPPISEETRLALYATVDQETVLDGPTTEEIFHLLSEAEAGKKPVTTNLQGTLTVFEELTEQSFTVWVSRNKETIYVVDIQTDRAYKLPADVFFETVHL